ncbi:CYIR protein [Plasmodium cynomolgi strain B]|uniref:CYIR protein n=1 Tax=Plasmodium cynomolgi (strain B) TaxID=1120755 RepID=K6UNP2_PLACD|nr:CYIR protein [Plasmodium cynomolgi strain B]GAB69673.1 CYIR protein [Plasmodium cynomolgi strain B]
MLSSYRSTDSSGLYRKSSKELYSERFYEDMDMESEDLHYYNEKCNNITVKKHKDQMIPICTKYLRFLDKSKSWGYVNSRYDISLLLNYWIYEKLTEIYGDNSSDDIMLGFVDLQMKWGYFDYNRKTYDPYYKNCQPDLDKVNHVDWKHRKKLYDYYVDHDYVINMAASFDNECTY